MAKIKIALVVQGQMNSGGVTSVAKFIMHTIQASENFTVDLILTATTFNDDLSSYISQPTTWFKGITIQETMWQNTKSYLVGANFSELESQRYMPRKKLTDLFNQYDLIQVVAGGPALAYVTKYLNKPVCLFVATLARLERKSILKEASFFRKVYGYLMLPFVSRIEIQALQQCNHIFSETEYTRQAILPYIDSSKITIDVIGVDTQQFHPLPENQRSEDYILSVGRFSDARKNTALLIESYALLRQQMPDAPKLILAGLSGPTKSHWELACKLNVFNAIEFRQKVPSEELVSLYQNATVFALSSNEEGLGIVLLEAMACATPVVSTRCGGPNSVVSDDVGFLTPVGDATTMSERLLWLLQHPGQSRAMGLAGRTMIEQRFSKEIVGQKYLNIYERLLKL